MTKDNKSFCVLPFIHFALKPDGKAKPCCRFSTWSGSEETREWYKLDHNKIGTKAVVESEQFEAVRKAMLNGEVVEGCWKCIKEEKEAGYDYSMRTFYNRMYKDFKPTRNEPKYIEVSFGNYCNLSCRTCNSGLSSSWHDDDVKLQHAYEEIQPFKKIIDIPFNWKVEDFQHVEEIKFVGGEPMLNPNFNKFIETLLEGGRGDQITLTIFSNTSWFPKEKTINMLKRFAKVNIWMSIDAYGKRNDYIRNNSKWEILSSCAEKWLDLERETDVIGIVLTPTLNFLNVHTIDKLVDWWVDNRSKRGLDFHVRTDNENKYNEGDIVFSSVYDPEAYSLRHVPNKKELIKKYKKILKKYSSNTIKEQHVIKRIYNKIINMLHKDLNDEVDLKYFIEHTKDLDMLRKQNFALIFPEVYKVVQKELAKTNRTYETEKGRLQ